MEFLCFIEERGEEMTCLRDKQILYNMKNWMKKESVLIIAVGLAILSSFYQLPKWSYINVKVLILLFNLMLLIAAFKDYNVLDYFASLLLNRSKTIKQTSYLLVALTFVASMVMTNDVALITFVPLTLIIGKKLNKNVMKWVVIQTLAANLGSSLTPMGNPQNLFLYTYYEINLFSFLRITIGMTLIACLFLIGVLQNESHQKITYQIPLPAIKDKGKVIGFVALFLLVLASVIGRIDYQVVFVVIIFYTFIMNKSLFKKIDYSLLVTFIGFFIFVGNLASVPQIKIYLSSMLNHKGTTYIGGILLSQVISNVPAAMLLAPFTENWKEILLGVNVGGMGTLIASMASLISYRLYIEAYATEQKVYLKSFTVYNLIGLLIFIPIVGMLIFFIR